MERNLHKARLDDDEIISNLLSAEDFNSSLECLMSKFLKFYAEKEHRLQTNKLMDELRDQLNEIEYRLLSMDLDEKKQRFHNFHTLYDQLLQRLQIVLKANERFKAQGEKLQVNLTNDESKQSQQLLILYDLDEQLKALERKAEEEEESRKVAEEKEEEERRKVAEERRKVAEEKEEEERRKVAEEKEEDNLRRKKGKMAVVSCYEKGGGRMSLDQDLEWKNLKYALRDSRDTSRFGGASSSSSAAPEAPLQPPLQDNIIQEPHTNPQAHEAAATTLEELGFIQILANDIVAAHIVDQSSAPHEAATTTLEALAEVADAVDIADQAETYATILSTMDRLLDDSDTDLMIRALADRPYLRVTLQQPRSPPRSAPRPAAVAPPASHHHRRQPHLLLTDPFIRHDIRNRVRREKERRWYSKRNERR